MNPYDKAHELARSIRESQEFVQLREQKKRVDQDPAAKKMLDDFRHRQWEMERQRIMGETISEDDLAQMKKLTDAIQLHSVLRDYLDAEYRFGVLYSDLHRIIGEAVQDVIGQPDSM